MTQCEVESQQLPHCSQVVPHCSVGGVWDNREDRSKSLGTKRTHTPTSGVGTSESGVDNGDWIVSGETGDRVGVHHPLHCLRDTQQQQIILKNHEIPKRTKRTKMTNGNQEKPTATNNNQEEPTKTKRDQQQPTITKRNQEGPARPK